MPKHALHCEVLWGLVLRGKNGEPDRMMYRLSNTRASLWEAVVEEETYGTGWTKESLQRAGWEARAFNVLELAGR